MAAVVAGGGGGFAVVISRKAWVWVPFWFSYCPTIWPASLMPL
jgi:hypothetical protein